MVKLQRYTAICRWTYNNDPDDTLDEEIDIDAVGKKEAKELAQLKLDDPEEYEAGGKVIKIIGPRVGLYF